MGRIITNSSEKFHKSFKKDVGIKDEHCIFLILNNISKLKENGCCLLTLKFSPQNSSH